MDEHGVHPPDDQPEGDTAAGLKLRLGVGLWFLSWVPYGIILGLTGLLLALAWGFEVALGLIGIALAGSTFARAVKDVGWRRAPGVAWHALISGSAV